MYEFIALFVDLDWIMHAGLYAKRKNGGLVSVTRHMHVERGQVERASKRAAQIQDFLASVPRQLMKRAVEDKREARMRLRTGSR